MNTPIRVIQYGLGMIGQAAARLVLERDSLELIGAVDCHPDLIGQDLGLVLGLGKELNIPVMEKAVELFDAVEADAVIHCTGSSFAVVLPELAEIVNAGLHCVTSCEEALYPYYRHKGSAEELNNLCVSNSVSVLGTGVNPGFVMDTLPVTLTAVSQQIEAIRVLRVVNASTRREALQRKVGAGKTEADFRTLVNEGKLGHAGLLESLMFIAAALEWEIENVSEQVEPVLARGLVAGVRQVARAEREGREALRLELQMYVGAENPRDEIDITGVPPLKLVIPGGSPGDLATPAILVNMIPLVVCAVPGLQTMATLPIPHIAA